MSADPITQGIRRGAAVFGFLKAWRRNFAHNRRARRIRKGKCICDAELADDECPVHGTKEFSQPVEETSMLQGKLTHTGAGIAVSSPFVGMLVNAFVPHIENAIVSVGFAPAMCALEATNCVSAGQLAIGLVTGVLALAGGAIASYGRKRAEKRHAEQLAAALEAAKK